MAKKQRIFFECTSCGYQSLRWLGKCPECNRWDSLKELVSDSSTATSVDRKAPELKKLEELDTDDIKRIPTGLKEMDRVLGGGIVKGSLVMIGGDPGIGKSTIMLQMLSTITGIERKVYISGEESEHQISERAARLKINENGIFFLNENSLETIVSIIEQNKPEIVVLDSIQTVQSENVEGFPGNAGQLKYCTSVLVRLAKQTGTSVFLVGHVTKDGAIAGPKMLEHLVDTVMYFEGDAAAGFRILRTTKNRFGTVNELAVFQMTSEGLKTVENPSLLFLDNLHGERQGSAITATMEGRRALLVEVQALVSKTQFGVPQRTTVGIDHRRINLLLAVLEKRCGQPFSFHDVYIKTAGGFQLTDPAADLSICMALISSMNDSISESGTVYIGEVGLGGELRSLPYLNERINEAKKLGFRKVYIPSTQESIKTSGIVIKKIKRLQDVV